MTNQEVREHNRHQEPFKRGNGTPGNTKFLCGLNSSRHLHRPEVRRMSAQDRRAQAAKVRERRRKHEAQREAIIQKQVAKSAPPEIMVADVAGGKVGLLQRLTSLLRRV